jgi:CheY-like chemotaxis protein
VHDGRALIDAAERLRPDVIVTDISMPLLNGLMPFGKSGRAGRIPN